MSKKFKHPDFTTFFSFLNIVSAHDRKFEEKSHADKHPLR